MARLPRLAVAGQPHLLLQRGNNGQPIFLTDDDRIEWLRVLAEAARTHQVAVHAYVLLDDQCRLLATPDDPAALSRTMQAVGRRYVNRFNRLHGRSGTLWEGRFRAGLVESERYLINCMRYIETSPVRAGLVPHAVEYRWSSAAHHLGRRHDPVVTDHPLYWQLGNTPFEREAAYRGLLEEGLPEALAQELARAAQHGWALGSASFLDQLATQVARPVTPRPRGRPRRKAPAPAASA